MRMFGFLRQGPSLATPIALLALAVAMTGTTVAATGQLVNLVDPTDASAAARVTNGQLRVDGTTTKSVNGQLYVPMANAIGVMIINSSSTTQLTSIDFAPRGKRRLLRVECRAVS